MSVFRLIMLKKSSKHLIIHRFLSKKNLTKKTAALGYSRLFGFKKRPPQYFIWKKTKFNNQCLIYPTIKIFIQIFPFFKTDLCFQTMSKRVSQPFFKIIRLEYFYHRNKQPFSTERQTVVGGGYKKYWSDYCWFTDYSPASFVNDRHAETDNGDYSPKM